MLLIHFLIAAICVVIISIYLAKYADDIAENTTINATFIGMLLAAATSLPELVSALTSVHLGDDTLAVSNILGSNVFNIFGLALFNVFFVKHMILNKVSKENIGAIKYSSIMYVLFILTYIYMPLIKVPILHTSVTTIIIVVMYFISLKDSKNGESVESNKELDNKKLENALKKFMIFVVLIVLASMVLAKIADELVIEMGLNNGGVGAILVGGATSLPELITCFSLIKFKKYDMATASIIGSNTFNFLSLSIVDFMTPHSIYSQLDSLVVGLCIYGIIFSALIYINCKFKINNKIIYLLPSFVIIGGYLYLSFNSF